MHRDDQAILLDMVTAARLILRFRMGLDLEGFLADIKTQSAVCHQVLILGEAVKRLSAGFRSAHPEIPWSRIAKMRDKMIHQYEVVDPEEVWKAAEVDVPALLAALEPLLSKPPSNQP